jgi:hypothetical protein
MHVKTYPKDPVPFVGYVRCAKCIRLGNRTNHIRKGCIKPLSISHKYKPCYICGLYYGDVYDASGVIKIVENDSLQMVGYVCQKESCKKEARNLGGEIWGEYVRW